MNLTERIAYIRGLADGLKLDGDKDEVKVINAIIDLLEDMAYDVTDMEDIVDDVCNQVDEIDEDLGSLEEDYYEIDEDECSCGCHHHHDDEDEDYEDDDDDDCRFEVTCPSCGDTIELTGAMLDEGSIECPGCGENLEFDFDEFEDESEE